MAAWRIQRRCDMFFLVQRTLAKERREKAAARAALNAEKAELVRQRRTLAMERIVAMFMDIHAQRIQKRKCNYEDVINCICFQLLYISLLFVSHCHHVVT